MSLHGTARQTCDALLSLHSELQRDPTWQELLGRLCPARGEVFGRLATIAGRYSSREARIHASDAAEVHGLAEAIEAECRGVTAQTAHSLYVQIQNGVVVTALQVGSLFELVQELFKGFIEKRVSELRKQCESDGSIDFYVPKKRYVVLPKSACFRDILDRDMKSFPELFDRQALLTALSYDATIHMDVAQHQIREALHTGKVNGNERIRCKPVRELSSEALRAAFWEVTEVSDQFSKIFRLYFRVFSGRDLVVMWDWAKPRAVRVADFLDGVRNFQIDIVNRLYGDLLPYPLPRVHGRAHFAPDWVQAGRLAPQRPLTTVAEFVAEFDALGNFGVERWSKLQHAGRETPRPRRWWPSRGPTMMRPLHYGRRIAPRKNVLPERGGSIY